MQVHCISVSEHIWVGGCGPRGVEELPARGIHASQGTFSSLELCQILGINHRSIVLGIDHSTNQANMPVRSS